MLRAHATVADGGLKIRDRQAFDEAVGKLPDGRYVLTLEDEVEARSSKANRFYFGAVVEPIMAKTGYRKHEVHDILKHKFNPKLVSDPETGEIIEVDGSTADMTVAEFQMYVDSCIEWAHKIGVDVQPWEDF